MAASAVRAHLRRALDAQDYQAVRSELEAALSALEGLDGPIRENLELVVWMDYSVLAEHYGDLKAAVEYNEKLALAMPEDSTSLFALARLYGEKGDAQGATETLSRCAELAERLGHKTILAILTAKGHLPEEESKRAQRLADAVSVYRNAVREFTVKEMPERHAAAQAMLGRLLRQHAELLVGAARARELEEAASAYREALKVHTAEVSPDNHRAFLEKLREVEQLLKDES